MLGDLSDGTCSMDPFCPVPSGWLTDSVPVFLFQRCRLITQAESVSSVWSFFPLWRILQLRREQSVLISAHQINCTQNFILEWIWMRLKDHEQSSSDACCLRQELKLQSLLHPSNAEKSPRIEFPQSLRPMLYVEQSNLLRNYLKTFDDFGNFSKFISDGVFNWVICKNGFYILDEQNMKIGTFYEMECFAVLWLFIFCFFF